MLLSYMTDTPRCPKTQRVFKKKKSYSICERGFYRGYQNEAFQ